MPLTLGEAKGCSHVAYDGVRGERYRFPDGTAWTVNGHWATRVTGFKAVLIAPEGNAANSVLSFAGTDSIIDALADLAQATGNLPPQYTQAVLLAVASRRAIGDGLNLAGHSLGGGLAAYCSSILKIPTSTVNPAPLVGAATLSALFARNTQITNYIARGGEIVSSSPGRTPGTDVYVPSRGGTFGFFTDHMLANVAPGVPLPVKI